MDAYATPADLAAWLGLAATSGGAEPAFEDMPDDAERLLLRASELVEGRVLAGYAADRAGNPTDPEVAAWLRDAACAQVEFWLLVSEEHGIGGVSTGTMSAGGVTHNMPALVGPRVLDVLDRAGLRTVSGGARPYARPLDLIARTYTRVDGQTIEQTTAGTP